MEIIQKGYYTLKWGENSKTLHFSRLALGELKRTTGIGVVEWGNKLQTTEDVLDQVDILSELVYAGFLAYDKEEGNEIDYNVLKVGNWLWDAMVEDQKVVIELMNNPS